MRKIRGGARTALLLARYHILGESEHIPEIGADEMAPPHPGPRQQDRHEQDGKPVTAHATPQRAAVFAEQNIVKLCVRV
jgi:hypothetical protein